MPLIVNQRYRIGENSFVPSLGEAYEGYDLAGFRSVTVWLLPKIRGSIVDIFFSEHRRASSVGVNYTPAIWDQGVDTETGQLYIVFEPIKVRTLESVLADCRILSHDKALWIFAHVLEALRIFHEADIIHGRLNPLNLLMTRDSQKLIGFGLAYIQKIGSMPQKLLPFLSPEQLMGEEETKISDLYAAGAILFKCLLGESVFVPTDIATATGRHQRDAKLREEVESLPVQSELKAIIARLLEFDPSKRYLMSKDVLRDLAKIQSEDGNELWKT